MTKKQLIEALAEFPDDKEVLVYNDLDEELHQIEDFPTLAEDTETGNAVIYIL